MKLRKLRSGRMELAVCVLGPLVVLGAILVPVRMYLLNRSDVLAARQSCLEQVPKMERQLTEARGVLHLFSETGTGDSDRASELTLVAEKAAQNFGFTTRLANVEKEAKSGVESLSDYKLMLSGSGTFKSIIGMLDFLEQPAQRFHVKQVSFKANGMGTGVVYDGNLGLVTRTVSPHVVAGKGSVKAVTTKQAIEQTARLNQLSGSVKAWVEKKHVPLLAFNPDKRKGESSSGQFLPVRLFTLNGIARDKKNPLAMTDRGVFGIGEKVDGYTISAITDDHVVLVDQAGRRETVLLYRNEAK